LAYKQTLLYRLEKREMTQPLKKKPDCVSVQVKHDFIVNVYKLHAARCKA